MSNNEKTSTSKGCDQMLVAKTGDGCLVSLISSNYSRSALISLKTKKRFFCPVCGRAVTLKMGSKRKWHFAHDPNQPCLLESEPESAAHLSGKEDLFFWLESRGLKPELEFYLPQIKQRPDILLPRPLPGVAFEYQCSSIAADIWMKRTMGYIQAGIQPLWLIGSRRQRKKGFISKLSGFEPLAIRSAPKMLHFHHPFASPYYLIYYDPEQKQFCFLNQLHSAGETTFITEEMRVSLADLAPRSLFAPSFPFHSDAFKRRWLSRKKSQRLATGRYAGPETRGMRKLCYAHRLVFSAFPPFIGLPHHQYLHLAVPPYLWQLFIYLLFYLKYPTSWITIQTLNHDCRSKAAGRLFRFRALPLCEKPSLPAIIRTYLNQLAVLNVIERRGEYYHMPHRSEPSSSQIDDLLVRDRVLLETLEKRLLRQTSL